MPNPRTVIDTIALKFSDNEILQRVASRLDDGSMCWKVDIIGGLSVTVGDIDIGAVNILNAADVQINPMREETGILILAAIGAGGRDVAVQTAVTRDANDNVLSVTEDDGVQVKTTTITRDADDNVLSIAEAVV